MKFLNQFAGAKTVLDFGAYHLLLQKFTVRKFFENNRSLSQQTQFVLAKHQD